VQCAALALLNYEEVRGGRSLWASVKCHLEEIQLGLEGQTSIAV
jgi:hypothetical protein